MCGLSVQHCGNESTDLLGVVVLGVLEGCAHACQAFAVSAGAFGTDGLLGLALDKQFRVSVAL